MLSVVIVLLSIVYAFSIAIVEKYLPKEKNGKKYYVAQFAFLMLVGSALLSIGFMADAFEVPSYYRNNIVDFNCISFAEKNEITYI